MKSVKKMSIFVVIAGLFIMGPVLARAEYPEREVILYCSSSAGGTTDLTLRYLSEPLSKTLGQPFMVVNKPGAGHVICATLVANSKPDGYSLGGVAGPAFTSVPNVRKVPYDIRRDFTYIATCAAYTWGLTVRADAPWKTLEEFLDYAKKNPGKIIYSTDGHAGTAHIMMEYLARKKGGIDWKHGPYSGGARNAPALLGGHVHVWAAMGTQVQFVKDGQMRMLACFNETRQKYAPDVPTLIELGYVNHSIDSPIVIVGPKGLPEPILKKLEAAYLKAMKDPAYDKFLEKLNMPPAILGAKETTQSMEEKLNLWGEMARVTGIKEKEEK